MAKTRIEELLALIDLAFEGSQHSLLMNIRSVAPECWERTPPSGSRSVRDLVAHVGMFKFMYANHGFRDASMDYDDPPATPAPERLSDSAAAEEWLREGHTYLTGCIRELESDAELDAPRKAHWGDLVPTYFLVTTMLEHDLYHAGEINHVRALLQDDDRWRH